MKIPIEPDDSAEGLFSGLLHLQSEFYTRLTEETMRYMRRLQGAVVPATPGTVLLPDSNVEMKASGIPGAAIQINLEFENRQRVHCVVTPTLTQLVGTSGATWFPPPDSLPPLVLVAPEETANIAIKLLLPANIPCGTYRGALVLQGIRGGTVPIVIIVNEDKPAAVEPVGSSAADPAAAENLPAAESKKPAPRKGSGKSRRQS